MLIIVNDGADGNNRSGIRGHKVSKISLKLNYAFILFSVHRNIITHTANSYKYFSPVTYMNAQMNSK